jgi:hypothetical protein
MEHSVFAYSLREEERGWSWRVYDRDGEIVAAGEALSKTLAQGAVQSIYVRTAGPSVRPSAGLA